MFSYNATNPYAINSDESKEDTLPFASISKIFSSTSGIIGKLVLPSQSYLPEFLDRDFGKTEEEYNIKVENGLIYTHDGATLDTVELVPNSIKRQENDKRLFIVKFNGNGGHYESLLNNHANEAVRLQAVVIAFNYRGVGNSHKSPNQFNDLVTDGICQVNRLLDGGADPEKIILDGHSLGGGIATMVAKYFHDKNIKVFLWNDRSFSSLSHAAAGILAPDLPGIRESVHASSWSLMNPAGWDVDVASSYKSIPSDHKGYMYVSKKNSGDGVISHDASLHRGVKASEIENDNITGHKMYSRSSGHGYPRRFLQSAEFPNKSGQDVFEDFVRNRRP